MATTTTPTAAQRRFARVAQVATWLLALTWASLITLASGVLTATRPLAARLPDLVATAAFVAAIVVGAAVVHTVLEAAITVFDLAARPAPSPRAAVERPAMILPAAAPTPIDVVEARPLQPIAPRHLPATA